MEYIRLGRTGLKVSRICLGTMNFGPYTSEADSYAIMNHALEMGINFFDTANVYGKVLGEGVTEQIVGRWLEQDTRRRNQIVLATKVYGRIGEGINQRRLSSYHIRQAIEGSLQRLKTDHIDLYQMHHVDRETPWEEIWQAMELLVQQGKILYVGSSNFAALHIAQAQCAAEKRHFLGLVSEQSLYNLTARTIELEVIPACQSYGLGLLPWSPLAGGILGGSSDEQDRIRRSSENAQKDLSKHRENIDAFENVCKEINETPANVALAWLLNNEAVTAPIIGPRTLEQLDDIQHATQMKLSDELLDKLDEIWPGPGGAAPEAYAW